MREKILRMGKKACTKDVKKAYTSDEKKAYT